MKYIEASQFGGPEVLELKEKQTPSASEGMLLVKVEAAGINFADVMARAGYYPPVPTAPFSPGLEIAGVVTGVGSGVNGFKEGDHVAAITMNGGGYAIRRLQSHGSLRKQKSEEAGGLGGLVVSHSGPPAPT